jgi:polysaccharide export outer membrane protein
VDGSYLIGPGDVLEIAVWKDEALTKSTVVRPDGNISFPLIGEMAAEGKTVSQLKAAIEARLSKYVPDVDLYVNVQQVNSMIVYVIGKVNSPGRHILNAQVNVLQLLATAGGLNPFAKRGSIKIFRQDGSKTRILNFDYDDVTDGKHLEQNVILQRGDVVVVP